MVATSTAASIDRPRHATVINYFLRSLHSIPRTLHGSLTEHHSSAARLHSSKLAVPRDSRADIPLRAQSVCLAERPKHQYARTARSADAKRVRYERFHQKRPQSTQRITRYDKPSEITVKQQNRTPVEKIPFAVSVQNLSIPMKYADNPKPRHSTSKPHTQLCNKRIDVNKTKCNPSIQVSDKRPSTARGKETENHLLLQISEAREVSDFERILNSNAILSERAQGPVWRRVLEHKPSASVVPRPRSSYSLHTVSQTYHYLFQQHEESLQPLIDNYRQASTEHRACPPGSLLGHNWYENLQTLSEFYEDDEALQEEIETINDRIIDEEVKVVEESQPTTKNKNFNVNLADLIGLHVTGESCTSLPNDDIPTPEIEKGNEEEKEWLAPIMSANSDDQDKDSNVDCLAQNLQSVNIESDGKVPAITFSNCCDGCVTGELSNNPEVVIHLTVPSVKSLDESRPPMM